MNLIQYLGLNSGSYYHSEARANYDPRDRSAYYLDHSPRAGYTGLRDSEGIPLYQVGRKVDYLPVLNSLYALGHGELFRRSGQPTNGQELVRIADWFVRTQDANGFWYSPFSARKFGLEGTFPSAMIQGMAISTLMRAFMLNDHPQYPECATKALRPFELTVDRGGVTSSVNGQVFYEEYPSVKPYHVLNGFIYAIWGLHDLARFNGNSQARALWDAGLTTLIDWLPRWDIGHWSRYHISSGMTNPATIPYHKLHIQQLRVMHAITGEQLFENYAELWEGYLKNRFNALRTLPSKILWNLLKGF